MVLIIGLLLLTAAVGTAVAGAAANSSTSPLTGETFVIFGQSVTGLTTGQIFLYGVIVGVAGMLGLAMLLGTFNRQLASRESRRALQGSRDESAALREDRDRLTQQREDERTLRPEVASPSTAETSDATPDSPPSARNPAHAERPGT